VPQQGDFGFWEKPNGKPLRPEITQKMLREVFDQRMLHAALCAQSSDKEMAFTAKMVLSTLTAVRNELKRRMK